MDVAKGEGESKISGQVYPNCWTASFAALRLTSMSSSGIGAANLELESQKRAWECLKRMNAKLSFVSEAERVVYECCWDAIGELSFPG